MKRPIYFDARERDLARRVFDAVFHRLDDSLETKVADYQQRMAIRWTRDEVQTLATKFEEPTSEAEPERPDA